MANNFTYKFWCANILVILFSIVAYPVKAQNQHFSTDTLGTWDDEYHGTLYLLGERWYMQPEGIQDTIYFSKRFDRNRAKAVFEFDQTGICYLKAGRLECGKWGGEFLSKYAVSGDTLSFYKWDDEPFFDLWINSPFLIHLHTADTMILYRITERE